MVMSRALKPDAQAFDEIRIFTVPRYKTSELSGDEWRISATIEFKRKGKLIHVEESYRNVEVAANHLGYLYDKAVGEGHGFFAGEGEICDQEGCSELAAVTYKKKSDYCVFCANEKESVRDSVRKFCDSHKTRGDCGIDDSDINYIPADNET